MLKLLLTVILATLAQAASAQVVCGMYLIEDYTNLEVRSLTNMTSNTGRQVHYTIQNSFVEATLSPMIAGVCYCVQGEVALDPAYCGDRDFRLIHIDNVDHTCDSRL